MLYFLCTLISNTNWPSLKWHKAFQQISEIAVNLPPWHVVGKKHTNSHANKWIELLFICLVSHTASEFHLRSAKKKKKHIHISACYRLLFLQDTSKIKAGVRTGVTHNMPYKMFSSVRSVQIFSSKHFLPFYGYMLLYKRHGKILKN